MNNEQAFCRSARLRRKVFNPTLAAPNLHLLLSNTSLVDPDLIIIGGGIGQTKTPLCQATIAYFATMGEVRPAPPDVINASLGASSGLIGAALMTGLLERWSRINLKSR